MHRWIILAILLFWHASPLNAQASWQVFKSDLGSASFSYPSGWQVIATERSPSRFVENYAIQPVGQSFSGYPGQVALRVFDPMYVVEESGSVSPGASEALFQRFVRAMPGGGNASFGIRTYGGRRYYYAHEVSEGFATDYAGSAGANGYLNVVAMASNPRESATRQNLLFNLAASIRSPGPPTSLDGPAMAVRDWYRYLGRGEAAPLTTLACSQARLSMLLMAFANRGTMEAMVVAARGYNFSGLRYETLGQGSGRAMVRISGNMLAPGGRALPVHRSASLFGGSNVLLATYEGGAWRVCGPVRGGYS